AELEKEFGPGGRNQPAGGPAGALFPDTNPLLDELKSLDVNSLSPIEALNRLFEWQEEISEVETKEEKQGFSSFLYQNPKTTLLRA
ncbi:MAG: hypothetical protein U5L02_09375, partial [Rheinheimera sp.]|nr:hypothetical protein [Rheinheimera sp.]